MAIPIIKVKLQIISDGQSQGDKALDIEEFKANKAINSGDVLTKEDGYTLVDAITDSLGIRDIFSFLKKLKPFIFMIGRVLKSFVMEVGGKAIMERLMGIDIQMVEKTIVSIGDTISNIITGVPIQRNLEDTSSLFGVGTLSAGQSFAGITGDFDKTVEDLKTSNKEEKLRSSVEEVLGAINDAQRRGALGGAPA